jgi:type IV secretory pathway TrbL component
MIDGELLNRVTSGFAIALDGAYAALTLYSVGLLAILATLYFFYAMSQGLVGYATLNEALGSLFWVVCKIGVFYWLLRNLYDLMWNGAFRTFAQWGLEASGGGFRYEDFLGPGTIVMNGFKAAYPMKVFADQFIGPMLPLYLVDISVAMLAYWVTVFSFGAIALAVMAALIEMKMAIATSGVLIPWAILTQTAFLGELSIANLAAGLVRILVTALIMGIAIPLFTLLAVPNPQSGVDPSVFRMVSLAVTALIFAILAWVIPNRAAAIGGRGMALAVTGADLAQGSSVMTGGVRSAWALTGGAIHGVSRLRPAA